MKVFEIFNDTKYAKTYLRLMDRAKDRKIDGYLERHHVHPKSLGGKNEKSNIVSLSAREHFVAHLLLPKALVDKSHSKKMGSALNRMLSDKYGNRYKPSSKLYDVARKAHADAMFERDVSQETRAKISKAHKGKIVSAEARAKQAAAKLGKPGVPRTDEWKAKQSEAMKRKWEERRAKLADQKTVR